MKNSNGLGKLKKIPSDWERKNLAEVGDFQKGNGLLKEQLSPKGIPCVRYGEIYTTHDTVIKYFSSFISKNIAKESVQIKRNDILFAGSGETREDIGKAVAYLKDEVAYAGGDIIILRPFVGFDSHYLSYALQSEDANRQKYKLGEGHSVVHIYPDELKTLKIPLPPLPEQKAIAAVLSTWDTAIETTQKLIEQKERRKKALMQQLLSGKKRLKGFDGKWEEKKIGSIAEVRAGATPSTNQKEYWGGNIRWMNSGELNNKIIFDVEGRITKEGLKNSSTKMLPKKCVLIGLAGQGKTRGTVAMNMVELCTNQSIAAILPNKTFLPEYLYYNLDIRYEELRKLSTGDGGRGGLNLQLIKSIHVRFPQDKKEQHTIVEIFKNSDKEIELLEQKVVLLKEQKKGLMQKLLTGQVRVKAS